MNLRSLAKNAGTAFLAQGISFLASVLMSLFVPKVLGVAEYGYWQLFVFYASYVGFFHFGLNDGVYLLKGGQRRDEVDKRWVNSQFCAGALYQSVVALAVAAFGITAVEDGSRSFVILFTALFLLLNNLNDYFGYVFQAMNETKLYSEAVIIDRLVFLVPLAALVALSVDEFEAYILAYAFSKSCSLAFTLWQARDFLASGWLGLSPSLREAWASIRVGLSLMLANIANSLVLGIARALIDANWGIEVFGKVSFSLSLANFFLTFVNQAAMVLFPALRQSPKDELVRLYRVLRDALGLFSPAVYALYFPMMWLVGAWLPQYAESLHYFAMLLPVCVFNSKMSICATTYLKVLRRERSLLALNVTAVALSGACSLLGVYALRSVEATLVGVVSVIALRALAAESWVSRELAVPMGRLPALEVGLTVAFVALALCLPDGAALASYVTLYCAFLALNRVALRGVVGPVAKRLGVGQ